MLQQDSELGHLQKVLLRIMLVSRESEVRGGGEGGGDPIFDSAPILHQRRGQRLISLPI